MGVAAELRVAAVLSAAMVSDAVAELGAATVSDAVRKTGIPSEAGLEMAAAAVDVWVGKSNDVLDNNQLAINPAHGASRDNTPVPSKFPLAKHGGGGNGIVIGCRVTVLGVISQRGGIFSRFERTLPLLRSWGYLGGRIKGWRRTRWRTCVCDHV